MPFMILFGLIFGISVILIIVFAIKNFYKGDRDNNEEEILDVLKKRLSKGEITYEEYEKLKKTILN